jgi:hypothetical protein
VTTNLGKTLNVYTLVSVVLGASGAILAIFGNNHLVGSILAGLAVVSVPLHGLLSTWVIDISAPDYALVLKVYAALVVVTAAASIINQWVLTYTPALRGDVTLALTAAALLAGLMAQAFNVTASKASAKHLAAHA